MIAVYYVIDHGGRERIYLLLFEKVEGSFEHRCGIIKTFEEDWVHLFRLIKNMLEEP